MTTLIMPGRDLQFLEILMAQDLICQSSSVQKTQIRGLPATRLEDVSISCAVRSITVAIAMVASAVVLTGSRIGILRPTTG